MAGVASTTMLTLAEYCEITGTDKANANKDFEQLEALIDASSLALENWLHRFVVTRSGVLDIFPGNGTNEHWLDQRQLNALTSIHEWDGDSWEEMTSTDYPRESNTASGVVDGHYVLFGEGDKFASGTRYKITYDCGWVQASVPRPLKLACATLVQRMVKNIQGKEGITSESFGDQTTSYNLDTLLPAHIRAMVAPYRRLI